MKLKNILPLAAIAALAVPGVAQAAPKAKLRFSASTYVVSENAGSATIKVTRQPRKGKSQATFNTTVSVNYATSAGTAGAGDYDNVSGTLTFGPGEIEKTFTVPVTQDGSIEGPETVRLALSAPSRLAAVVNPSSATLAIADDDGPVQLHFSAPSYSVSEFGPNADVTVIRTGQLRDSGNVPVVSTVDYATANGTAGAADYTASANTLSFGADDVEETISVPVTQDSLVEGNEGFSVTLSNPTNAAFANAAATLTAPVTIVDDDTASGQPELSFESAAYSGAENAGGIAVTVVRSGPVNSSVSAWVRSVAGSAVANVDFTAIDDELEFGEGDLTQTLMLPVLDDAVDEADETLSVELYNLGGGNLGTPATSALTILDNDEAPVVGDDTGQPQTPDAGSQVVLGAREGAPATPALANPFANDGDILVLGARIGSCKLTVGAVKSQRILKAKRVRVKLHAAEACAGTVKSHVKGRKSLRGVKKGAVQTKVAKFSLKAGQTKTITLRFTKRGYSFLKRALGKQKTLSASLLVRSINSSKRTTLNTLRFKAKA